MGIKSRILAPLFETLITFLPRTPSFVGCTCLVMDDPKITVVIRLLGLAGEVLTVGLVGLVDDEFGGLGELLDGEASVIVLLPEA